MLFHFDLGEQVKVKSSGRVGEVLAYKHEKSVMKSVITETVRYYVKFGSGLVAWVNEDEMVPADSFDPKFEKGFLDLLIDVFLKKRDFETVQSLSEERSKFIK